MIKKISIMKKDIELKNTPFGSGPYGGGGVYRCSINNRRFDALAGLHRPAG